MPKIKTESGSTSKKKTTTTVKKRKSTKVPTSNVAVGALSGAVAGIVIIAVFLIALNSIGIFNTEVVITETTELIEEESATIGVVESVSPAVVSVVVRRPASLVNRGINLFGRSVLEESEEDELVEVGSGTAFFVDSAGLLLTNKHVVDVGEGVDVLIVTDDETEYKAEVIAVDMLYDVAVLRIGENIPEDGFPTVKLAQNDEVQIGQTVIAIGNALAEFNNTVTRGIISGTDREIVAGSRFGSELIREAIQTDAAINPGNSGGPLINLSGEVVGINTAISNRGSSLGFAIPISVGKKAIDDVKEFGKIVRPWLGIRYVMLDRDNVEGFGFVDGQRGAYILPEDVSGDIGVVESSPAQDAGLLEGDVIIKVNGDLLDDKDDLAATLNTYHPGDIIELDVIRDHGDVLGVSVTLGEFDETVLE